MILLPKNVAERIKIHEYLKSLDFEELKDNPVCPKCERVACKDIGWTDNRIGTCPQCGYHGKMPVTLEQYAKMKLYK